MLNNLLLTEARRLLEGVHCPSFVEAAADEDLAKRWDALAPKEREKLLKKDKSMRDPRWAGLVVAMAKADYNGLTNVQKDAVAYLLKKEEVEEPRKFEIRKDGSKWHLYRITSEWPNEHFVMKFQSKTMADLFAKALDGDGAAAKKWYRLDVTSKLKLKHIYNTPQAAWKATAQTAHMFGFPPSYVHVDKDTGEPL